MTFLAPGYLLAGLAVAGVIAALHFIVLREPRAGILPTARFVPDTPATTVAAQNRPTDVLLMVLRMLIVVAAGAALARPVLTPSRRVSARVILVDVSRSARDSVAMRERVGSVYRDGDALVLFDSSARLVVDGARDSIGLLRPGGRRGNLSGAMVAAMLAGSALRDRADSLELVFVSPFTREEFDAATDTIRKLWRGKATLIRVANDLADTVPATRGLQINATSDDALSVTAAVAGRTVSGNSLIDRSDIDGESSRIGAGPEAGRASTSTSASDRTTIRWPAATRPRFAVARATKDTVRGVRAGDASVVGAFARTWMYPPDSLRGADVIARWVDGEPAAIEKPDGDGCMRSVAIPVTPVGDLVIRQEFVRLVTSLSSACAWRTALLPVDPADVAALEGQGGLAPRSAFQPMTRVRSDLAPWLFVLALAAAIAELLVRRRRTNTASAFARRARGSPSDEARAA